MAKILTRQSFMAMTFDKEDVFTAYTNMYVSQNYEQLRGKYFHIANESATSDLMRMKLWSMGVIPGVPDFEFLLPYKWWLELKLPKGRLSPAQVKLHKEWRDIGEIIHVAWTSGEVVAVLESILGSPKFV